MLFRSYVESVSSGFTAGVSLARRLCGKEPIEFTTKTAIGAMGHYVSDYCGSDFQPMNINFGIIAPLEKRIRSKQERYTAIAERALAIIDGIIENEM